MCMVSSHLRQIPMPHLTQTGMMTLFLELLESRHGIFLFSVSCQGCDHCQEGSHSICICTNISVKNFPSCLLKGMSQSGEYHKERDSNGALIRKFITFAFDHNAY